MDPVDPDSDPDPQHCDLLLYFAADPDPDPPIKLKLQGTKGNVLVGLLGVYREEERITYECYAGPS